MKKILVAAMVLISAISFAQGKIGMDAGLELGMPMGDFGDVAGLGFGGSLKGYYPVNPKMDATLRTGYIMFTESSDVPTGYSYSISEIPIMAGISYKLTPEFYGMAEVGMTVMKYEYDWEYSFGGYTLKDSGDDSDTYFSFGLGAGYRFKAFDFALSFNSVATEGSNANNLGLRVAYRFM